MKLIEVNKITLGYENQKVIEDFSLVINEHDFITIIGANGSGKSTFVKGLLGLIKPMKGSIDYFIDSSLIGYMPQESKIDRNFPASSFEIVLSGAINRLKKHAFFRKNEKHLAHKAFKTLHIEDLKYRSFQDLSGGQRQKVLLARAIVATTSLLVLDEPSNNLDYKSKQDFYRLLHELNHQGLTIVMISHDMNMPMRGNKVISFDKEDECE